MVTAHTSQQGVIGARPKQQKMLDDTMEDIEAMRFRLSQMEANVDAVRQLIANPVVPVTVNNFRVSDVTDTTARVLWDSSVELAAVIEIGYDGETYPNVLPSTGLVTQGDVLITGLLQDSAVFLRAVFPDRTIEYEFVTNADPNGLTFSVIDNEAVLTSTTHTVVFNETSSDPDDRYDLIVNGVDQGPSVPFDVRQITGTTFSDDGSIQNVELHRINSVKPERNAILYFTYTAFDASVTTGNFVFESGPTVSRITQTGFRLRYEFSQNAETWVEIALPAGNFVRVDEVDNLNSATHVRNIENQQPGTQLNVIVYGRAADGTTIQSGTIVVTTESAPVEPPTGLISMTFAEIAAACDIPRAIFTDNDPEIERGQWEGEFCYQNPSVRYFNYDRANRRITEIAAPEAPQDAVVLPAPSGGDDTAAVQAATAGGGDFVGNATGNQRYRFTRLLILDEDTHIWDMPWINVNNSAGIDVRARGAWFHNCPAIGEGTQSAVAFLIRDTGPQCRIVDSGYQDVNYSGGNNGSVIGVDIIGADEVYIAGGVYQNLINSSGDSRSHMANAFRVFGANNRYDMPRVTVINSYCKNFESSGTLEDSEVMKVQGHKSPVRNNLYSVRMYGVRAYSAGKRFFKAQDHNCMAFSCFSEWEDVPTQLTNQPKGRTRRFRLHQLSCQTSTNNCYFRHNRFRIMGDENWGVCFNMELSGTLTPSEIHCDRNDWYFEKLPTRSFDSIFSRFKPREEKIYRVEDCSISDNYLHGPGGPRVMYSASYGNTFDRFDVGSNVNESGTA